MCSYFIVKGNHTELVNHFPTATQLCTLDSSWVHLNLHLELLATASQTKRGVKCGTVTKKLWTKQVMLLLSGASATKWKQ